MNFWTMALGALTKFPFEKFIVKSRDREKAFGDFEKLVGNLPTTPSSPREEPDIKPGVSISHSRVSDAETVAYQKRELCKALLLLEMHFQQGCKISGKPCDCCEKHPMVIEALAEEALGMTGDQIFEEVTSWAKLIAPITTEEASRSGQYTEEYPQMAVIARGFRKRIMGSDDVRALMTPELSSKVDSEVEAIIEKMKQPVKPKEGGEE